MNKYKAVITIILIVGLLFTVPTSVSASSSDIDIINIECDGHWSGDNWHLNLYPGDVAEAEITFKNRTDETLEVELDTVYSTRNLEDNIDIWWDYREFDIKAGRTKERTLFVEVLSDAAPGYYELEFEVVWEAYKTVETQVIYRTEKCKPITIYEPSSSTSWELPPEPTIIYQYPIYYPPATIPDTGLNGIDVLFWISVYIIGIGLIGTLVYLILKRKRQIEKENII